MKPGKKNVVEGDISNVGSVRLGDDIHNHIEQPKPLPKALTTKIPRLSREKIVGREADLADLHRRLFDNKQVVLVNGMGGIGKTTLAQVYVNEYWEAYHHIAWISQLSPNIAQEFVNTEGLLGNLSIKSKDSTQDLFNAVIAELNRINKAPNLLIIDNADSNLMKYRDSLPGQPAWHVLVTSREQIETFDIQEIGFLSEDEAVELFLRHYTREKIPHDKIRELVRNVDLHTLTIEILAKTAHLQRVNIDTLQKAIADDLKANVYVEHKKEKIDRVTSYLCSIFTLSALNIHETWLLKQFVCLPAEFHSYEWLRMLIRPEATGREDVFSETIETLYCKGWLLKDTLNIGYRMHRIVASVVKIKLKITAGDISTMIAVTSDQLQINPVESLGSWLIIGSSILSLFHDCEDLIVTKLIDSIMFVYRSRCDYNNLNIMLKKQVESGVLKFGSDHPVTADRRFDLVLVLQVLEDYEEAITLLERVTQSDEINFGKENTTTANRYELIALGFEGLEMYQEAKMFYEKVVCIDEKTYGSYHSTTLDSYTNLIQALIALEEYDDAKKLLVKVLILKEETFGSNHLSTANSYCELAKVYKVLGEINNAKKVLRKATDSYSNFAAVFQVAREYNKVRFSLETILEITKTILGSENLSTAISNFNLALFLEEQREYEEALMFSEKSLHIFTNVLPPGHPTITLVTDIYQSILKQIEQQKGR